MAEVSEDATLLIATSWQALGRAVEGDEKASVVNCAVVIVFAGFFVEANLNHILEALGRQADMEDFFKPSKPGLQQKLGWYYSEYAASSKATNKEALNVEVFRRELLARFPGFEEIYRFRNDVAHGHIDRSLTNLIDAKRLRDYSKAIVDDLFGIAQARGREIPRLVTYDMAISSQVNQEG